MKNNQFFINDEITFSKRYLHTPVDFAKHNLIYLQEVGTLKSLKPHRCIRNNVDSFLFFMVKEGKGELIYNNEKYIIEKGDGVFIDCMKPYEHLSNEENGWELEWVHFNGNNVNKYFELFRKNNSGKVAFRITDKEALSSKIHNLLEKQKEKDIITELNNYEYLVNILNMIIGNVINFEVQEMEDKFEEINEVREFINENYAEKNLVENIQLEYREVFNDIEIVFMKQFGISMRAYIDDRRFTKAKELLRFTIKPIEEIVDISGFPSKEYLQNKFDEKEGMLAEEYRMKWAQWIR